MIALPMHTSPDLAVGALYESLLETALRQFFDSAILDSASMHEPRSGRVEPQDGGLHAPIIPDGDGAARTGHR